MNLYLKNSLTNLFHLGFIQLTNITLQLLLIPLVVSRVGIPANGLVLTALSLSGIGGIIINFGTNQTLPPLLKVAKASSDGKDISIQELIIVRFSFFVFFSMVLVSTGFFLPNFKNYLFAILPLLFAEVVNPYAIFLGLEKLKAYNFGNLISRIFALAMVFLFVKNINHAPLVNFFVGISQSFVFTSLMIYLIVSGEINYGKVLIGRMRYFIQENSSLTVSNVIVQFQQSIFLYALGLWHSGIIQGAYAIVDKLVWGGRMILVAISNALYPSAISAHALGRENWSIFRKNVNRILAFLLIVVGVLMFILAPYIATALSVSEALALVVYNIKCISILPFIIGMNMLNVLELIMENQYKRQMYLSLILMILSILVSALFLFFITEKYSILYLVIIESICLILYEKNRYHTA